MLRCKHRNEDAERDCTTVLSLNPGNVKALFRRGQARMGTDTSEKLQEAQKGVWYGNGFVKAVHAYFPSDFQEALRLEPKNDSARAELEKVQGLLKSKKSRVRPFWN